MTCALKARTWTPPAKRPVTMPSDTGITGAFVGAFHNYLANELKYETTDAYRPTAYDITGDWDFKHRPPAPLPAAAAGPEAAIPALRCRRPGHAIRKNPQINVFSANGYFDLATPFFITEYDSRHMCWTPTLREEHPVRLLPLRPHGLSEHRCAEGIQARYGRLLRPDRSPLRQPVASRYPGTKKAARQRGLFSVLSLKSRRAEGRVTLTGARMELASRSRRRHTKYRRLERSAT